jgi:hypothetical protein
MNKLLFFLLFLYSASVFPLEIVGVKNAQLKNLLLYNGSRLEVMPEQGVIISVKGIENKKVMIKIKATGDTYLTSGVRIPNLKAKNPIIRLDEYGEGQFEIGFTLLGEKNVSGKLRKQIRYDIEYLD